MGGSVMVAAWSAFVHVSVWSVGEVTTTGPRGSESAGGSGTCGGGVRDCLCACIAASSVVYGPSIRTTRSTLVARESLLMTLGTAHHRNRIVSPARYVLVRGSGPSIESEYVRWPCARVRVGSAAVAAAPRSPSQVGETTAAGPGATSNRRPQPAADIANMHSAVRVSRRSRNVCRECRAWTYMAYALSRGGTASPRRTKLVPSTAYYASTISSAPPRVNSK